ncbi:COG6-domain-containing protein [Thozetella sp. PMI_491]|nr:COG6-domain-containing protein [Thozetella sp. PMI_491]
MTSGLPPAPRALPLLASDGRNPAGAGAAPSSASASTPPTPSTPAGARAGFNPLSSKVTTVLSASYADSEFREALGQLGHRRVQNTAETRRQLRLDLQREVIESNGDIIAEFGKVADQLRRIGNTIEALNQSYTDIRTQITAAHAATGPVLQEASSLIAQKRQVEAKQELLKAFSAKFVLSDDEVAALALASEPVDDRFFAALSKAKRITKDCELLLGFENQTLGLEIMEQTTKHLNAAFQRLYRWIQREFKALNLENPQLGSAIRHALRVLAERPTLFQNCLDFFAEAREHILSDSFYTALTGSSSAGGEDPAVKPIELAAHDPLRYAGDMLAWAHSAAVGEREALEVLFVSDGDEIAKGIQAGRDNQVWRLVAEEGDESTDFDPVTALNELVDRDMSGAARILRQRVEQVIQANEDTILAYKLANLLGFYKVTFSKLLGNGSVLVESLSALETEALRQFRSLMRDHIATLQGDFQHTPADLSSPDFLQDALEQLTAIMKTYETSFTSSSDAEADFQPILSEALDPFLSGCENMAGTLGAPSDSIFLINCLVAAKAALSPYSFTERRAVRIDDVVEQESRKLAESQYRFFRVASGLDSLIASLAPLKATKAGVEEMLSLDSVQPLALTQASQTLDDFLPSALMDGMEKVKHLQSPKLAGDITEKAAERFYVDFEHVEEMLMLADELAQQAAEGMEEAEIQSLRALFPRTTGEIRTDQTKDDDDNKDIIICELPLPPPDLRSLPARHRPLVELLRHSTMLRNRSALPALQKTYDESYLTCSTAVYYESQGNEDEAMRCWKTALDQIHEHNASKILPNYAPRSETEKALVDSLRELELQCKERIDLLQALRLSRQASPSAPGTPDTLNRATERGWIGDGTIPALAYTQLSKPGLPKRPSFPTRTSSEQAVVGGSGASQPAVSPRPSSSSTRPPAAPSAPSSELWSSRTASPERHTMRTTLRTGRAAAKASNLASRSAAAKPAEGPSKAATLAWAALGLGDLSRGKGSDGQAAPPAVRPLEARSSSERSRRQWDSNSRRLVPSRPSKSLPDQEPAQAESPPLGHPDDHTTPQPLSLSITAASSALSSRAARDWTEVPPTGSDHGLGPRSTTPSHTMPGSAAQGQDSALGWPEGGDHDGGETKSPLGTAAGPRGFSARLLPSRGPKYTLDNTDKKFDSAPHGARQARKAPGTNDLVPGASEAVYKSEPDASRPKGAKHRKEESSLVEDDKPQSSEDSHDDGDADLSAAWKKRRVSILRHLPPGVDEHAAKQILNEIVVQGDEVHWGDIAGLDTAKNALREAVVYPFLRPDLFMGLREPARGMLLFGPPGTGKTMLARAVATESRSTFFSISATSLTSKYLGESEKLVRALFSLAKHLAPSIIFVDEIDSLLSQRSGSSEHEATRRIKTEFLIQWSDLQRAAAGRETVAKDKTRGDANRVLVLAATNLPWAIDEAARRRFVRRQYIPLPESETREIQIKTLLQQQKHTLSDQDIAQLVALTDGFSGSDITALAKDAAMGPLRSVGDALLHMTMDDIRPMELSDFMASLTNIRPSVNRDGLKAYEDWAREFGERGG